MSKLEQSYNYKKTKPPIGVEVMAYCKDGKLSSGILMDVGDPYKVEATCINCKHEWQLIGINTIDDLI